MSTRSILALCLGLTASCAGLSTSIQSTGDGKSVSLTRLADRLEAADVVFLGELHDNDEAHRLQLELIRLLGERRSEVCVSMEMFERDVQSTLDAYLVGEVDEETFLAHSRPWGNYVEHYRPIVELARERGWPVLASNAPRRLAREVARNGVESVEGAPYKARTVDAGPGEYKQRFMQAMTGGAHVVVGESMDRFFAAQCLKDDTMAESIVAYLALAGDSRPLIVHLCGRFHSDYDLGTVERLRRRMPGLEIAVITTETEHDSVRSLPAEERDVADFVWFVPR